MTSNAAPLAAPARTERSLVAHLLGTWFGCGLFPIAPGTVGTLGALAVAYALHTTLGWDRWHWIGLTVLLTGPGIWAAGRVARDIGKEDPGRVVIDEVLGTWITLAGAPNLSLRNWILAFVLFRILDIWKPFPVRRLERLHGGLGIVADDLAAGLYGALVLFLTGWLNR